MAINKQHMHAYTVHRYHTATLQFTKTADTVTVTRPWVAHCKSILPNKKEGLL